MTDKVLVHGLQVARELHDFVVHDVLPDSGVEAEKFWSGFAALAVTLMPQSWVQCRSRKLATSLTG